MFRPLEIKFFVLVSVPSDPLQSGGSLTEVAQSVSSRMALLEPEQLAQADARLASLVERFNQVPESLQKLPDLTKEFFKQKKHLLNHSKNGSLLASAKYRSTTSEQVCFDMRRRF